MQGKRLASRSPTRSKKAVKGMERNYNAAYGARMMFGGMIILLCCLAETTWNVVKNFFIFVWQNKLWIALGVAFTAFVITVPYALATITYIMMSMA